MGNGHHASNDQATSTGHLDGTPGCEGVIGKGRCKPKDDAAIREDGKKRRYGYIYLIRCLVNGKVYIGQTVKTVAKRWHNHVTIGKYKPDKLINPIDKAIRKYGEESFEVETLETVYEEYLGTREQYWIQQYDCCTLDGYDKGYNASRGGEPNRRYIFDEEDVIRTYEMGCSMPWIMYVLQIGSTDPIRDLLAKHGISIRQISQYNVSDLPECIIDAYYHNTGKERKMSSAQSTKKDIPIRIMQFDKNMNFMQVMHSYDAMVDWIMDSCEPRSLRSKILYRTYKRLPASVPHAIAHMFQYYWVVLDKSDDENSEQVISECRKLVQHHISHHRSLRCNHKHAEDMHWFDDNLDEIILMVVNSSFREAAKKFHITDNALKHRLKTRGLPSTVPTLFKYAVDHQMIDDPVGSAKNRIYQVFCETNNVEETIAICQCSRDDVYFACKYHGLFPHAVDNMRSKKPKVPVRPVNMYAKDGTYLGTFANMTEAGRHAGISSTSVSRSCRHENLQVPYYFRFADEDELDDE